MIRRERLAVVMSGEQHLLAIEIRQRDVGRESLLGVHQHMSCTGSFSLHTPQDLAKGHAVPPVVEPAPARDAMKIAGVL